MKTLFLLILLLFSSQALAGEYTRETPKGALYDVRTHDYKNGRVVMRPEFKGLYGDEKRAAYKAMGIIVGGHDHEKWLSAQERWKKELEHRQARRKQLAPRTMSTAWNIATLKAAGYYYSPPSPMTYFHYWCNVRHYWCTPGYSHHHGHHHGHHQWPYYGH